MNEIAERIKAFVREVRPGGCKMFSLGDGCTCPLCDVDTLAADLLAALATAEAQQHKACPCLHTTPCHPDCTCVKPYMSRGCARCCSYGSPEQQQAMAQRLATAEAEGRRQGINEAKAAIVAVQDERQEALLTHRCDDPYDCDCDYLTGGFNGLNEPLSRVSKLLEKR